METQIYSTDQARHDLEGELTEIVEQATKSVNERLSKKRNSLECPGYIVVNVERAISLRFGNTPKELKEVAKERLIQSYRGAGWKVDYYDGEYSFSRDSLSGLLYGIYLSGKYKFSLPDNIR